MAISKFEDISHVAKDFIINSPPKVQPFCNKGRHYSEEDDEREEKKKKEVKVKQKIIQMYGKWDSQLLISW